MKTKKELADFSDKHLAYEVQMLWLSAGILYALQEHPSEYIISGSLKNAFLDSFAIHARVLHDFFYPKSKSPKNDDDVTVNDYVSDWAPPKKTELIDSLPLKANKQVAHLTYKRVAFEREGRDWNYLGVLNDIVTLLVVFKKTARPGYLGSNAIDWIDLLCKRQIREFQAVPTLSGETQTRLEISMSGYLQLE